MIIFIQIGWWFSCSHDSWVKKFWFTGFCGTFFHPADRDNVVCFLCLSQRAEVLVALVQAVVMAVDRQAEQEVMCPNPTTLKCSPQWKPRQKTSEVAIRQRSPTRHTWLRQEQLPCQLLQQQHVHQQEPGQKYQNWRPKGNDHLMLRVIIEKR